MMSTQHAIGLRTLQLRKTLPELTSEDYGSYRDKTATAQFTNSFAPSAQARERSLAAIFSEPGLTACLAHCG